MSFLEEQHAIEITKVEAVVKPPDDDDEQKVAQVKMRCRARMTRDQLEAFLGERRTHALLFAAPDGPQFAFKGLVKFSDYPISVSKVEFWPGDLEEAPYILPGAAISTPEFARHEGEQRAHAFVYFNLTINAATDDRGMQASQLAFEGFQQQLAGEHCTIRLTPTPTLFSVSSGGETVDVAAKPKRKAAKKKGGKKATAMPDSLTVVCRTVPAVHNTLGVPASIFRFNRHVEGDAQPWLERLHQEIGVSVEGVGEAVPGDLMMLTKQSGRAKCGYTRSYQVWNPELHACVTPDPKDREKLNAATDGWVEEDATAAA